MTLHSPDRDRILRHKLEGGDDGGLLALIERVRARAAGKLGTAPKVVSCYEAGYDGFWLHRLLTAAGITNFVFDPASIAVEQRSRRAKTDRIDGAPSACSKLLGPETSKGQVTDGKRI